MNDRSPRAPIATVLRPALLAALALSLLLPVTLAAPGDAAKPRSNAATATKVDVNSAGVAELASLPGIGPALAQRIVEHRKQNGPFERVEQLLAVKGIGPKLLTKLRPRITVGSGAGKARGAKK